MITRFLPAALAIFRKDIQAELRSRELVSTMGLFALLSILVFSFALELDRAARAESVSGVLWVTIVFAGVLGLNRSMAMERENGGLDALLIAPIQRTAIYAGKLAGNLAFTLIVALLLLPLMTILYNLPVFTPPLVVVVLLGAFGFSAIGTVLAAMTVQTRARESLLPILMLPIALPLLLAAVRATTAIVRGEPEATWASWAAVLAALDMVFLAASLLTFEAVIEDA